jgi:hypothetical protein
VSDGVTVLVKVGVIVWVNVGVTVLVELGVTVFVKVGAGGTISAQAASRRAVPGAVIDSA